MPFLIGLYRNASQSDSLIFEIQKQNTKIFRSEEMAGGFSRFCVWKKWYVKKEIEKEKQDVPPVELNVLLETIYDLCILLTSNSMGSRAI